MICGNCGKQLYGNPKNCPYCGERVVSAYHGVPKQEYAREAVGRGKPREDTGYRYRPEGESARHVVHEKPREDTGYRQRPEGERPRETAARQSSGAGEGKTPGSGSRPASAAASGTGQHSGGGGWKVLKTIALICVVFFGIIWIGDKNDAVRAERRQQKLESYRTALKETAQETTYPVQTLATEPPIRYANEILLEDRDVGACGRMVGDIGVMYFFMDDANSHWTQQEIDAFLAEAYEEMNILAGQAVGWGVDLTFWQSWEHCSTTVNADSTNTSGHADEIIRATGRTPDTIHTQLARQLGTDQAYPVFIFNEKGRAFATRRYQYECCFLFDEAYALRHESCHIFGAADLYYTKDTTNLASLYLGESIMTNGTHESVDELTAYLIGWTEELYSCAVGFLEDISWMTQADMDAAAAANTITGYGVREYSNGARYEGNMYCGFPHGEGTLYYADGTWTRGNFDNGERHGWCEIYYVSGNYFQGEFVNGEQIGRGSFTWADGTWYEGEMKECHAHGYGTMHYASGQVRTGNWNMNTFLG